MRDAPSHSRPDWSRRPPFRPHVRGFGGDTHDTTETDSTPDSAHPDTPERGPRTRRGESPRWAARNDSLADSSAKQILVVGDTLAGTALTGFLRRAGYDPVLVRGGHSSGTSRRTCLWPSTLRMLGALGLEPPVGDDCASIERVVVGTEGQGGETTTVRSDGSGLAAPALADTESLRRALAHRLLDGRAEQRTVESVARRNNALEVQFADGVREWFDIAVDATRGGSLRQSGRASASTLQQYELRVDDSDATTTAIRDLWHRTYLVEVLPAPAGTGQLLRLTSQRPVSGRALSTALSPTARSDRSLADELAATDPVAVRQTPLPTDEVSTDWWGSGHVSACGSAAFPVAPASGFRGALAIEDAWTLVDSIVRHADAVPTAVQRYAQRRSKRLTSLLRAVTDHAARDYPLPDDLPDPLSNVGRLRVGALAAGWSPAVAAVQDAVFE